VTRRFWLLVIVALIATVYARWALESHIDAGATYILSSLLVAPPVVLYHIAPGLAPWLFWPIFLILEIFYVGLVAFLLGKLMVALRRRKGRTVRIGR